MKRITSKNNEGFTLIELLVVMGIIAILGTVSVTAYIGSTLKAARSEAYANLEALRMHEAQFISENARVTSNLADFRSFQTGPTNNYVYALNTGGGAGVALPAGAVAIPYNGATVAQANCFIATATGIPGTRVAGDIFAIDCNNNKNF